MTINRFAGEATGVAPEQMVAFGNFAAPRVPKGVYGGIDKNTGKGRYYNYAPAMGPQIHDMIKNGAPLIEFINNNPLEDGMSYA